MTSLNEVVVPFFSQIGLPNECFVFDIKCIGADGALASGLKEVLEAPNVQKVCVGPTTDIFHYIRAMCKSCHHSLISLWLIFSGDTQLPADVRLFLSRASN